MRTNLTIADLKLEITGDSEELAQEAPLDLSSHDNVFAMAVQIGHRLGMPVERTQYYIDAADDKNEVEAFAIAIAGNASGIVALGDPPNPEHWGVLIAVDDESGGWEWDLLEECTGHEAVKEALHSAFTMSADLHLALWLGLPREEFDDESDAEANDEN
jgi:hypothetical protein